MRSISWPLSRSLRNATRSLEEAGKTYETAQAQRQAKYAEDLRHAEAQARTLREENDNRLVRERKALIEGWRETCTLCDTNLTAIDQECQQSFPPWEALAGIHRFAPGSECETMNLPPLSVLPNGLPFGTLTLSAALIPHAEPEDARLPRLRLIDAVVPALLPFPDRASVLFKAVDDGREIGVRVLEALAAAGVDQPAARQVALHDHRSGRPGRELCRVHAPGRSGRGTHHQPNLDGNVAHRRTPGRHDDAHGDGAAKVPAQSITRPWPSTTPRPGKWPSRFVCSVVAHFPVNFSTDAARRLISLANAGARCGIFTLVMVDARQEMPHGVELADLEAACINLVWREGKFNWRDPDFGDFPLTLTMPPAADDVHAHPGRRGRKSQARPSRGSAVRVDRPEAGRTVDRR